MRKTLAVVLIICLAPVSLAFAGTDALPSKPTFNALLLPSSGALIGELAQSADAKKLAAGITASAPDSTYGFSTAVSEEQGSFKLGIVLADLKIFLRAGDREKVISTFSTLAATMVELGAPVSMITAVVNLNSSVKQGLDLTAVQTAGLAVLEPFVDAFVEQEGKIVYMRFGEWAESTRLAAVAGQDGNEQAIVDILQGINPASFFLSELKDKGLPAGVATSLTTLSEMGNAPQLDKREIARALKEITSVIQMMG